MNIEEFEIRLNQWGKERIPFLFVVDFEMEKPFVCRLEEAAANNIFFSINDFSNVRPEKPTGHSTLSKYPFPLSEYKKKFDVVSRHLNYGDSFLANLTIKTRIETNQTLRELFFLANAKYKLLFKDDFLVFSPETFVRIVEGRIFTFPMKGTIDAGILDAREVILQDPKELAEHVTIIDLMRSDLSLVSSEVRVSRFRYIDELKTNHKNLLQVSSEIEGVLSPDYSSNLGTVLRRLLPAGSVSGAPKARTLEIILEAEQEKRNYYTGVFGLFDGVRLESAVTIRYIEKNGDGLFYRSGGGITTQSEMENEYHEAIDKIYVPLN